MRGDLYKGIVLGAAVASVVLMAGTALAGTGVGSVFNLGKTNRVNAPSTLTGSTSGKTLQLTNTGTGPALGLKVGAGTAPMTVSSKARVKNLNADMLDGAHSSALVKRGGTGAVAVAGCWYVSQLPAYPEYVEPNRWGGEAGFACNGGLPEMTKVGTGHYRLKVEPALPGDLAKRCAAFVNADARSSTPLFGQAVNFVSDSGTVVWDVYVHDKNGAAADCYYIQVIIVTLAPG